MELNYMLSVISIITTFFSGFFCRKRNVAGIIICSFVAQVPVSVSISMVGISKYVQKTVDTPTPNWVAALICVLFIWGIGYVCGGINMKKKGDVDDLPGKDVKYEWHRLD